MRDVLIRLLFRLIDLTQVRKGDIDEIQIREWLAMSWQAPQFRDYIHRRDMEILQAMGEGQAQRDYDRLIGQRTEIGKWLTEARWAHEKVSREGSGQKSKEEK